MAPGSSDPPRRSARAAAAAAAAAAQVVPAPPLGLELALAATARGAAPVDSEVGLGPGPGAGNTAAVAARLVDARGPVAGPAGALARAARRSGSSAGRRVRQPADPRPLSAPAAAASGAGAPGPLSAAAASDSEAAAAQESPRGPGPTQLAAQKPAQKPAAAPKQAPKKAKPPRVQKQWYTKEERRAYDQARHAARMALQTSVGDATAALGREKAALASMERALTDLMLASSSHSRSPAATLADGRSGSGAGALSAEGLASGSDAGMACGERGSSGPTAPDATAPADADFTATMPCSSCGERGSSGAEAPGAAAADAMACPSCGEPRPRRSPPLAEAGSSWPGSVGGPERAPAGGPAGSGGSGGVGGPGPRPGLDPTRAASISLFTCLEADRPEEAPCAIAGALPEWLRGTLYWSGPGLWTIGRRRLNHSFDGFCLVGKYRFLPGGRAASNHRFVDTAAYRAAREEGRQIVEKLATPQPFESWAAWARAKMGSVLGRATFIDAPNAHVFVASAGSGGRAAVFLPQDPSGFLALDATSLRTSAAPVPYADDLGTTGQIDWSMPSICQDPLQPGRELRVGTSIGGKYVLYSIVVADSSTGALRRMPLGRVGVAAHLAHTPALIMWAAASLRRIVVPECPLVIDVARLMFHRFAPHVGEQAEPGGPAEPAAAGASTSAGGPGPHDFGILKWLPGVPVRFHAVDRATGATTTHTLPGAPFYLQAAMNAFDTPDGGTCVDMLVADTPGFMRAMALSARLAERPASHTPARLVRVTLPPAGAPGEPPVCEELLPPASFSGHLGVTAVNPTRLGVRNRFLFATCMHEPGYHYDQLVKIDYEAVGSCGGRGAVGINGGGGLGPRRGPSAPDASDAAVAGRWSEAGTAPTGALTFVPRPGALEEDDGVLLVGCASVRDQLLQRDPHSGSRSAIDCDRGQMLAIDPAAARGFLLVLDGRSFTELARVWPTDGTRHTTWLTCSYVPA